MRTTLVANVAPLPNDQDLVSVLDRELTSPLSGEPLLWFGVEGPEGHVYRVIKTNSWWQTARLFDMLTRRGLVVTKGRSEAGFTFSRVFRSRCPEGSAELK